MPSETPQGIVVAHAAEQLRKRDAFALRLEIPDSVFKRGLGHAVAAHQSKDLRAIAAMVAETRSRQHRPELVDDHLPGACRSIQRRNTGRSPAVHSPQPVSPF